MQRTDTMQKTLAIQDSETKSNLDLETLPHNEAYNLLGVQIAFDGNSKAQIETMWKNCTGMAKVFSLCTLSGNDVKQGYNCVFAPSIKYPLPATAIKLKTLQEMRQKVV
jgi:hypothetical protein